MRRTWTSATARRANRSLAGAPSGRHGRGFHTDPPNFSGRAEPGLPQFRESHCGTYFSAGLPLCLVWHRQCGGNGSRDNDQGHLEEQPLFDPTRAPNGWGFRSVDPRRRSRPLLAVGSRRRRPVTAVTAGHDAASSQVQGILLAWSRLRRGLEQAIRTPPSAVPQVFKGGVHTAMYGSPCCRPGGPSALAWRSGLGPRWWSPVRITGDLEGCFRLGSRRQAGGAERRTSADERVTGPWTQSLWARPDAGCAGASSRRAPHGIALVVG